MAKQPITRASGITPEVLLKLGQLYSSKELRGIQTKLTTAASELRKLGGQWNPASGLLGRLGERLTAEQRQLLLDAAQLIESIGANVVHAKEKRQRTEKETQRRRDLREKRAKLLVASRFPLPVDTQEQMLDVLKTALTFNRARIFQNFYSPYEFCQKQRPQVGLTEVRYVAGVRYGSNRERGYSDLVNDIISLRYDLLRAVEDEISYDDGSEVEERLVALKKSVADRLGQIALTAQEQEVLQLWTDALTRLAPKEISPSAQPTPPQGGTH